MMNDLLRERADLTYSSVRVFMCAPIVLSELQQQQRTNKKKNKPQNYTIAFDGVACVKRWSDHVADCLSVTRCFLKMKCVQIIT